MIVSVFELNLSVLASQSNLQTSILLTAQDASEYAAMAAYISTHPVEVIDYNVVLDALAFTATLTLLVPSIRTDWAGV